MQPVRCGLRELAAAEADGDASTPILGLSKPGDVTLAGDRFEGHRGVLFFLKHHETLATS